MRAAAARAKCVGADGARAEGQALGARRCRRAQRDATRQAPLREQRVPQSCAACGLAYVRLVAGHGPSPAARGEWADVSTAGISRHQGRAPASGAVSSGDSRADVSTVYAQPASRATNDQGLAPVSGGVCRLMDTDSSATVTQCGVQSARHFPTAVYTIDVTELRCDRRAPVRARCSCFIHVWWARSRWRAGRACARRASAPSARRASRRPPAAWPRGRPTWPRA